MQRYFKTFLFIIVMVLIIHVFAFSGEKNDFPCYIISLAVGLFLTLRAFLDHKNYITEIKVMDGSAEITRLEFNTVKKYSLPLKGIRVVITKQFVKGDAYKLVIISLENKKIVQCENGEWTKENMEITHRALINCIP